VDATTTKQQAPTMNSEVDLFAFESLMMIVLSVFHTVGDTDSVGLSVGD